jgi:hypothetical protein
LNVGTREINMSIWMTIESWYDLIMMIVLCVCSIKAYRKSLKKIFLLFVIISLPTTADRLYQEIDHYLLTKQMTSISRILTGKFSSERKYKDSGTIQRDKEISELWTECVEKQKAIDEKYSGSITKRKKHTWIKDSWQNIVWRLSSVLFPIAGIIICIQEIKSSNQNIDPTRKTPVESGRV